LTITAFDLFTGACSNLLDVTPSALCLSAGGP
jgi:hypothetical protein